MDLVVESLVKLQHSKGITVNRLGNPAQLEIGHALCERLHDIHAGSLVGASDPSITPSNEYLIDSLLCHTHQVQAL